MKALITLIILALLAWGGYVLFGGNEVETPTPVTNNEQTETPTSQQPVATSTSQVREFTVVGKNFSFSPATLQVNRGDRVRITFQNQGGNHDWVIDEFNARTKILSAGQSETIEFVADRAGSFEYYCSVGTHRQMGMKGTLVVQ